MTSLNPLHTILKQVGEVMRVHQGLDDATVRTRVLSLLRKVGLTDPEKRLDAYPYQLSGGQRQRVMIAMALANEPDLLIADEPTTALDVTIQAQILELLKSLQRESGMAMLLITHDLGVVRKMADRVYVMSEGKVVEEGGPRRCSSARGMPTPAISCRRSPRGRRRRRTQAPRSCWRRRTLRSGSRSRRVSCAARSTTSRRSTASPSSCAPARHWGSSASPGPARPRSASRCCGSSPRRGPSPTWESASTASGRAPCGPCARRCRWCSRTPTARCRRASR